MFEHFHLNIIPKAQHRHSIPSISDQADPLRVAGRTAAARTTRTDAAPGRMGRLLAAVMPLLAAAAGAARLAATAEAARVKHAPWRPPAYNTSAACW